MRRSKLSFTIFVYGQRLNEAIVKELNKKDCVLVYRENKKSGRDGISEIEWNMLNYPGNGLIFRDSEGLADEKYIIEILDELILKKDEKLIYACRRRKPGKTEKLVLHLYDLVYGKSASDPATGLWGATVSLLNEQGTISINNPEAVPVIKNNSGVCIRYIEIDGNRTSIALFKDIWSALKRFINFSSASIVSIAVDYLILWIIISFFPVLALKAYIIARTISSALNFGLNRLFVFKGDRLQEKLLFSLIKYYFFFALALSAGAILVNFFSVILGWNIYIVKLFVDGGIFIAGYVVQREIIFKRNLKIKSKK